MTATRHRIPWALLVSGVLLAVLLAIIIRNWAHIQVKTSQALTLIHAARPGWLALAAAAILVGFLCAGQIYGRVLATLGYKAPSLWLCAAAMVTMLCGGDVSSAITGTARKVISDQPMARTRPTI